MIEHGDILAVAARTCKAAGHQGQTASWELETAPEP